MIFRLPGSTCCLYQGTEHNPKTQHKYKGPMIGRQWWGVLLDSDSGQNAASLINSMCPRSTRQKRNIVSLWSHDREHRIRCCLCLFWALGFRAVRTPNTKIISEMFLQNFAEPQTHFNRNEIHSVSHSMEVYVHRLRGTRQKKQRQTLQYEPLEAGD